MSDQQQKLDILLKWFNDNNIKWNKEALSIKIVDNSFGVYTTKDMKKNETIVKIPKESILSTKTCGISNILDEANLEGGCPLALAVLYEIAQKERSPWYGYLQALPEQGEDLPIFWDDEEKKWFKGTEMEIPVYKGYDDIKDDYHELVEPLLNEHPYIFERSEDNDPYSFEKFIKISTLISSRAFQVDAFHETALVPFADLFNHSGQNEHVHFETEFEVCEACGVLEYCEHQYFNMLEDEEDEEDGEDENENDEENIEDSEDEDVMEEDEDEDEEEEMDTELPDLEELEKQNVDFWDKEEENEKKDYCDMVLDRDVRRGEEIFNTYGDHPSASLLSKYGFCYDDNKNDYITISEDAIVDCCLGMTNELIKEKYPKLSEEKLESMATEKIRSRLEFFLENEQKLCPIEGEGQEEMHDDFEDDCEDSCCGDGEHDHGEGDEDEEEHEHDHTEDGCCGEEEGASRPFFINSEGLFEDKAMCMLHIMLVNEEMFEKFIEDIENALKYFEELADSQGKKRKLQTDVKHHVYKACLLLADFRRKEYLEDNGEWKSVEKEIEERKQVTEGSRRYNAMTCRINEKKIIEKSVNYYNEMVKEHDTSAFLSSGSSTKQNGQKKLRK
ncbi:hypothetical protein G6F37_007101 [Rhizopus arrhizus]|nr:hypothetical protein G6F38_007271 [Rhizopus arrhizus]KAG1157000.1 hypothetical protein G6F37_007101 [Rhizopus arrhizus]